MPNLGPGVLTIGETGSEIDASCLVNNARISADKDEGDSKTMLCGTSKAGKVTYTYALSGSIDVDSDTADGLFALSQQQPGSEQPFTFTPDSADGTTATGTLILDPLDFGADEYGDPLDSDFEFTLVGAPEYSYGTPPEPESQRFGPVVVNGRPRAGVKPDTATTSSDVAAGTLVENDATSSEVAPSTAKVKASA